MPVQLNGSSIRRRAARFAAAMTLAAGVAGCGGAASPTSSSTTGPVLTVGTLFYIDTLNPFDGIETQDDTAYGMLYPQLVQYGPGLKLVGDWAESWAHSANGLQWTFHLHPGGKWTDGKPLTAADAAWTINTMLRYSSGPTAYLAGTALQGASRAVAPSATTLVIDYSKPEAAALADLEQLFVLPQHVWDRYTGDNGKQLDSFKPEQHLPVVAGGAYTITKFNEKGSTVFRPNPYFYGPRSHSAAVVLTYYTNATSMLADLEAGKVDFVDAVPYQDASKLEGVPGIKVAIAAGSEVTNFGINSNPARTTDRELLNLQFRKALEYAIPRAQIASTVFGGHAVPWADIMSAFSKTSGWVNPAVKPLPYDPAEANRILDQLGYKMGPNGVRVVPATTGSYAQPAHPMSYSVIVPDDLDFDGTLQFQILQTAFRKVGIQLTEVSGGDGTQSYNLITGPNCKYTSAQFYTWYWHPYIDPNFNLSVVTKAQWCDNSDTGMDVPMYDRWWQQQASMTNPAQRQALVWKMEAWLAGVERPYIQLEDTDLITAYSSHWTGFQPQLWTYCKCYYTTPHQT
ncbi:MAG: ABC transporter substrate-binding protein [Acidimicrobiales bacterium]